MVTTQQLRPSSQLWMQFGYCRAGLCGHTSLLMYNAAQPSLQGLMRDFGYEVRSAVVLTPYRAQLGLLQREFQKVLGRGAKELAAVEFATVDGFQVDRFPSCSTGWWGGGHRHCHHRAHY